VLSANLCSPSAGAENCAQLPEYMHCAVAVQLCSTTGCDVNCAHERRPPTAESAPVLMCRVNKILIHIHASGHVFI